HRPAGRRTGGAGRVRGGGGVRRQRAWRRRLWLDGALSRGERLLGEHIRPDVARPAPCISTFELAARGRYAARALDRQDGVLCRVVLVDRGDVDHFAIRDE